MTLLAFTIIAAFQCSDGSPPPCSRAPAARAVAASPSSVAVLFLESRDTSVSYLADGLTEDIATSLGRVERVQVKNPSSVRRAQRAASDLRTLGRSLNVHYVVDGSLRRVGTRYRVAIRLVAAQTEVTAWGNTYDRTAEQLLDLPAEVATAVAGIVGGTLDGAEQARIAVRPTLNPAAYDRYLRANHFMARRSGRWAARALAEYEAAIALDPQFVPALARLSTAYYLSSYWGWPIPRITTDSLKALAVTAARRVLVLDSLSSEAWVAQAGARRLLDPIRFGGVIESLERAVQIDPRNGEAWHQLGFALFDLQRDSAAAVAYHRALAIEPDRPVTLHTLALLADIRGHAVEAIRWEDSAMTIDPDFEVGLVIRAVLLALSGRYDEARRDAARIEGLLPGLASPAIARAWIHYLEGDSVAARAALGTFSALTLTGAPGANWLILGSMMSVGDRRRAIDALVEHRPLPTSLRSLLRTSFFAPLRSEPGFLAMIAPPQP